MGMNFRKVINNTATDQPPTAGWVLIVNSDQQTAAWGPITATGAVASVTAGDASIVIGGSATNPTVETGTLDTIASTHPPAGNWSNNSVKITNLANGSSAQDAAAFGQISSALTGHYVPIPENVDVQSTATGTVTLAAVATDTLHYLTITGNITTLNFPTAAAGASFSICWKMGGSGSYSISWPTAARWAGQGSAGMAPTIPTAASSIFATSHVCYDGTHWESVYVGQFA